MLAVMHTLTISHQESYTADQPRAELSARARQLHTQEPGVWPQTDEKLQPDTANMQLREAKLTAREAGIKLREAKLTQQLLEQQSKLESIYRACTVFLGGSVALCVPLLCAPPSLDLPLILYIMAGHTDDDDILTVASEYTLRRSNVVLLCDGCASALPPSSSIYISDDPLPVLYTRYVAHLTRRSLHGHAHTCAAVQRASRV
jgi:hypothetical protein